MEEKDEMFVDKEDTGGRPVYHPRPVYYVPPGKSESRDYWPGLMEGSYIYSHLERFGNTVISYKHVEVLVKHVWHMYFGKHCPKDVRTNKRYEKKYEYCLKMIEDYISQHFGKPVRLRYVISEKAIMKEDGLIHYVPYHPENDEIDDFWIIDVVK